MMTAGNITRRRTSEILLFVLVCAVFVGIPLALDYPRHKAWQRRYVTTNQLGDTLADFAQTHGRMPLSWQELQDAGFGVYDVANKRFRFSTPYRSAGPVNVEEYSVWFGVQQEQIARAADGRVRDTSGKEGFLLEFMGHYDNKDTQKSLTAAALREARELCDVLLPVAASAPKEAPIRETETDTSDP